MNSYEIQRKKDIIKVRFNHENHAQNDEIVKDAYARLTEMIKNGELNGGGLIKINGPSSVPVGAAISYVLATYFSVVSIFDPKMHGYVVIISKDPKFNIGDLIREDK